MPTIDDLLQHELFNNFSANLNTTLSSINNRSVSDKETSTIEITTPSLQKTKDSIINTPFWIAALIMISLLTLIGLVTVLRKHYEAEIQKCNPFQRKNPRDLTAQEEIEMNGGDGPRRSSLSHMHFGAKIGDMVSSSKRSSGTPSNVGSPTSSNENRRHSIISFYKRRFSNDTSVVIEPSQTTTAITSSSEINSSAVQRFYTSLNRHVNQMKNGIRRESGSSAGADITDDEVQVASRVTRILKPDEIQFAVGESNVEGVDSLSGINNVAIKPLEDNEQEHHSNEEDSKASSITLNSTKHYLGVPDLIFTSTPPKSTSSTKRDSDPQIRQSKKMLFARNRSLTLRTDSMTTRSNDASSTKQRKITAESQPHKERMRKSRHATMTRLCSSDYNEGYNTMVNLKCIQRALDHLAHHHEHKPHKRSSRNQILPSSHHRLCRCPSLANVHRSASFGAQHECSHMMDTNFCETQTQYDFHPHRRPHRSRRTDKAKRAPLNKWHNSRETLLCEDNGSFGQDNQCDIHFAETHSHTSSSCQCLAELYLTEGVPPPRRAVETWVEEQSKTVATIERENIDLKSFNDGAMMRSSSTTESPSVYRVRRNQPRYPFVKSYSIDLLLHRDGQDASEEAASKECNVHNVINKNLLKVPEIPTTLLDFEYKMRLPASESLEAPIFAADTFIYVNDWNNKSTESLTAIDGLTHKFNAASSLSDMNSIKSFGECRKLSDTSDSAIQRSEPSTSSDENHQQLSSCFSTRHVLHRQSHLQRLTSNSSTSSRESFTPLSQNSQSCLHGVVCKKIRDSAYQTKENSTDDRGEIGSGGGGLTNTNKLMSFISPSSTNTNDMSFTQDNLKLVVEKLHRMQASLQESIPSTAESDPSLTESTGSAFQAAQKEGDRLLPPLAIALLPKEIITLPSTSPTQTNAFQRRSLNSHIRLMSQVSEEQLSETETDSNPHTIQNNALESLSRERMLDALPHAHISFGRVSENSTDAVRVITSQHTNMNTLSKCNVFTYLSSKYQDYEEDFEEMV